MVLTISKLKMWADPGYTRNCPEVPPLGSRKLPPADWASAQDVTFRPSPGSTLTSLKIPLSYTAVFRMSYLYIEASDGYANLELFGWIDSIEQSSTAAESVTINWTVDWWRSYSNNIIYKSGIITKSPIPLYKRPYRTQPRHWKLESSMKLKSVYNPMTDCIWCYIPVVCSETDPVWGDVTSMIKMFFFPVGEHFGFPEAQGGQGATLTYLYKGLIDEFINSLSTSTKTFNIIGVYLAPIAPKSFYYDADNHIWMTYSETYPIYNTAFNQQSIMCENDDDHIMISKSLGLAAYQVTDDMRRTVLTDCNGNIYGTLPYGVTFDSCEMVVDIGTSGGYLNVTFRSPELISLEPGPDNFSDNQNASPSLGVGFTIPLPTIPVTENQWSDYMVSGQRDYDITSARIANEQRAIGGIESTIQSAIGGGIAGSAAGPAGVAAGAVSGGLMSGIMTGVNYYTGERYNEQLQDAKDRLYANQKNGILLSGNSYNRMNLNRSFYPLIITMIADSVSIDEYTEDIALNGYDTYIPADELFRTINSTTTGPYRIINLEIAGQAPPQAKQYIKDKFAQGVRIRENNPEGVIP